MEPTVSSSGSPSERLALAAGAFLERRISRRGLLARAALGATAFAVAPIRYLLRPGNALAVIAPGRCPPDSKCNDGYTAFCCEIEHGANACPAGTYVAGWWKCTNYVGRGVCHEEGVRYYLDCNRIPGHHFPGGCQCARGDCGRRRVDCNHFRYGQCNTHVKGTTEVVCRIVICQNPASVTGLGCNATEMIDDNTCIQDTACLHDLAVQLPGGAGI
ncbi:MAG: hypothetical protein ACR2IP_13770 [Solirubrobacteraceae bacterium]